MEALQMAQVLADLSSLQNTVRRPPLSSTSSYSSVAPTSRASSPPPTLAPPNTPSTNLSHFSSSQDPTAASNLVGANKKIDETHVRRKSMLPEPAQFDKLGRRRLTTKNPSYNNGTRTPIPIGLPRMGSSFSSVTSSGAATPTNTEPLDEDMNRAKKLLELYEMRGKFKQMGDTGLARAKERVDKAMAESAQNHPNSPRS